MEKHESSTSTGVSSRPTNPPPLKAAPTRLLRRPEVLSMTGLATSTMYAHMARGTFPKPRKIGARSVAWTEESIVDWINSRPIAELRTEEA